jgi:hypothetical protein
LRADRCRVQTGGFCPQGREDGSWDCSRLHPTDYDGCARRGAGHQAFAANRPAGCSGVQAAESELRNGPGKFTTQRTTNNQTSGHVESRLGKRARSCAAVFSAPAAWASPSVALFSGYPPRWHIRSQKRKRSYTELCDGLHNCAPTRHIEDIIQARSGVTVVTVGDLSG